MKRRIECKIEKSIEWFVIAIALSVSFTSNASAQWPTSPSDSFAFRGYTMYIDPLTSRTVARVDSFIGVDRFNYFLNAILPNGNWWLPLYNHPIQFRGTRLDPSNISYNFYPDGFGGVLYGAGLTEFDSTLGRNVGRMRVWRVDSTGNHVWGSDGVIAGQFDNTQVYFSCMQRFVGDGEGSFYFVHTVGQQGISSLCLQRFNANGQPMLPAPGVVIPEASTLTSTPFNVGISRTGSMFDVGPSASPSSSLWILWWLRDSTWTLSFSPQLTRNFPNPVLLASGASGAGLQLVFRDGSAMFTRNTIDSLNNYLWDCYTSNGQLAWSTPLFSTRGYGYYRETPDSGFVAYESGWTGNGNYFPIVRYDRFGQMVFRSVPFDTTENCAQSIPLTLPDGYTLVYSSNGWQGHYLQKLDPLGNRLWQGRGRLVSSTMGYAALRIYKTPANGVVCVSGGDRYTYCLVSDDEANLGSGFYVGVSEKPLLSAPSVFSVFQASNSVFKLSGMNSGSIAVFDVLGRKIYSNTSIPPSGTMILTIPNSISSGRYFIRYSPTVGKPEVKPILYFK